MAKKKQRKPHTTMTVDRETALRIRGMADAENVPLTRVLDRLSKLQSPGDPYNELIPKRVVLAAIDRAIIATLESVARKGERVDARKISIECLSHALERRFDYGPDPDGPEADDGEVVEKRRIACLSGA